ncbi:hypothetical protein [Kitasatospora sp. NPDC056531]|uniref:hypothetical protein n=1 Tax=Kitasatospora sp. NPDC056531 TaxID=3345856 RepID=UPI003699D6C5
MPTSRRLTSAAAAAALTVAGLSACSSSAPAKKAADLDPQSALTASATAMTQQGNARFAGTGENGTDGGSGSYGWKAPRTFQMAIPGQKETDILVADGVSYYGGDKMTRAGGKKWLKYDSTTTATMDKTDLSVPSPGDLIAIEEDMDPIAELTANAQADTLSKIGTEKINNADAVHIRSTIKTDAWIAALPDLTTDQRTALKGAEKNQKAATYDFWINNDNQLVQEIQSDPGHPGQAPLRITYSDYGKTPTITPPPAADVMDATELAKHLHSPND